MRGIRRRLRDVEPHLNHRKAKALSVERADDELPEPQTKAVRLHPPGCGECWAWYARYVAVAAFLVLCAS